MIYKVNGGETGPTYFDDANVQDARQQAEQLLEQRRQAILVREAVRFSVCATFVEGGNIVWREVIDTDPDDIVCKVFDTMNGSYTEVPTKTAAMQLNQEKKEAFLASLELDRVYELEEMEVLDQPLIFGADELPGVE